MEEFDFLMTEGRPKDGIYLRSACDEATLKALCENTKSLLDIEIPEGYLRLLRRTDGLQIGNVILNGSKEIIEHNLSFRDYPDDPLIYVLVLGSDGNVAHSVYDPHKNRYEIIGFFSPEYVFGSFTTIESLLLTIVKEQGL